MNRGAILFTTVAALACSACLADQGKLEIRSVETGVKASREPIPYRIAEAYGQLALGNVALALEGFRKASREDPNSVDALAGIAQCYDKMARFDLSRRYFEQALAIAPREGALLALFASSLDQQGLRIEAASVRSEMAALPAATPIVASEPDEAADARQLELAVAAPALAQSAESAAPVGKSVTIALAPPRLVEPPQVEAPKPVDRPVQAAKADRPKVASMAAIPVGKSVTIALPPLPPARVTKPVVRNAAAAPPHGPRIERVSLTEVALITGDGPRWKRPLIDQPRMAVLKPVGIRLLNAARIDKLAARTRNYLGRFGWREIIVGDAATMRSKSLILYPQAARADAAKLADRFGFAMAPRKDVRQLTIILGRDAADHPALRPKA